MSTVTKQFSFNSTAENWTFSAGGGTNLTGTRDTTEDATNDTNAGTGVLQTERTGKNKTDGTPIWEWSGSWTDLGVPSTGVVTAVNVDYDWKCSLYTTGAATSSTGPMELRDGSSTLRATFSTAQTFGATSSWATKSGTQYSGITDAASTSIKLRIGANPETGNSNSADVVLRQDWIVVSITYRNTFSYSVSGGLTFGGSATTTKVKSFVASGGATLAGSGGVSKVKLFTPSGGITFGGVAITSKCTTYSYSVSGGIQFENLAGRTALWSLTKSFPVSGGTTLNGSAVVTKVKVPSISGGITFGGAATTSYSAGTTVYSYVASGGLTFGGVAETSKQTIYSYAVSGGVTFNGIASTSYLLVYTYSVSGGITFNGSATTNKLSVFTYSVSGGITFTGTATTLVLHSYSYSSTGGITFAGTAGLIKVKSPIVSGGITLNGAASTSYVSGGTSPVTYTYITSGGTTLNGTVSSSLTKVYSISGGITFNGSATTSSQTTYSYITSGGITFNGTTLTSKKSVYSYICSNGITFSGTATTSKTTIRSYAVSGGVVFGGSATTLKIPFVLNPHIVRFSFNLNHGGWIFYPNGGTGLVGSRDLTEDSPNDTNPDTGTLQTERTGRSISDGTPYWEYSGTWESLGIPSNRIVTAVNINYDYRCAIRNTRVTSYCGPLELRDGSDNVRATFSTTQTLATTTSWVTATGTQFTGITDVASTSIKLRLGVKPNTGNAKQALTTIRQDWIVVTITHIGAYSTVASGGVTLGGVASALFTKAYSPSAGITFSGTTKVSKGKSYLSSGGTTFAGTADTLVCHSYSYSPDGGVEFGGEIDVIGNNSYEYFPTGDIFIFSGTASCIYSGIPQSYTHLVSGGIEFGDFADYQYDEIYIETDLLPYLRRYLGDGVVLESSPVLSPVIYLYDNITYFRRYLGDPPTIGSSGTFVEQTYTSEYLDYFKRYLVA